jgi:protein-L-isoaspartate(D-aspartate) O-methyltransferase
MVLARMLQGIDIDETDRTLIVGGGTGYDAAIAAMLSAKVVALESDAGFAEQAGANFRALGLTNIEAVSGKLDKGHAEGTPYNVIIVCGGVERRLDDLLAQLAPAGRLAAIQTASRDATRGSGRVVRYERIGNDISSRVLFDAAAPVLDEFREAPAFVF